jgi:hypothetical protein
MKIGFTGTRNGCTEKQKEVIRNLFWDYSSLEVHQGDCIGADSDFYEIACGYINPENFVNHPPIKDDVRAFNFREGNMEREKKSYFARNRDIVDETDLLIACPPTMQELSDGGTWYTINYARKKNKPIVIVWPDGSITKENEKPKN